MIGYDRQDVETGREGGREYHEPTDEEMAVERVLAAVDELSKALHRDFDDIAWHGPRHRQWEISGKAEELADAVKGLMPWIPK